MAPRSCAVVDVGVTASCGTLGLQHGYSSPTWLTVLKGDPANAGKVVVYGDVWAAWGTADGVAGVCRGRREVPAVAKAALVQL